MRWLLVASEMPVRFPRCVVPDNLRDDMDIDVVVQGQLQGDDTFLANEVIPRCPSKYEMQQRQDNGEQMPTRRCPARPPERLTASARDRGRGRRRPSRVRRPQIRYG